MAGESRSQLENKRRVIRRLKLRLAALVRRPIDVRGLEPPAWFAQVVQLGRLAISHRNPHHARTAALVLDLLAQRDGTVGDVAALMGVTTSSVIKFLAQEPELWSAANEIRKRAGTPPLRLR